MTLKQTRFLDSILIKPQIVNFAIMILSLGVVITAAVVRGGDGFKSMIGLNSCSFMSFVILIGSQFLNFYLSRVAFQRNRSKIQKYEMTDVGHVEGKITLFQPMGEKNFMALCYVSGDSSWAAGDRRRYDPWTIHAEPGIRAAVRHCPGRLYSGVHQLVHIDPVLDRRRHPSETRWGGSC
jgi:hypothetical protein